MEYFAWINETRRDNYRAKVRPYCRAFLGLLSERGYDPYANVSGCFR